MTMWAEGVLVNRVRIISGSPDELAARFRADRVLNMAGRQPAGLPPAAILCIRTITDPRPRSVVLHHEEVPRPEWTQAVSSSIADKARRAASPACGAVPADAEAVLFADKAELLACLASDWCQGRLREHWWWRALIRDGNHARRVVDAWLAAPMYVAAALEQLTRLQWGPVFVAALHETDTTALTRAVLRGHGLPEPCLASSQLLPRVVARPAEPQVASGAAATSSSDGTEPWLPWAPEAGGTRLRVDQKRLLGLALTVRRAPARMLTAAFVETVFSWTPAGDVVGRQRSPVPHEDGQPLADCPDRHAIASSSTADPIEAVSEVQIIAPEIARVPEDRTAAVPDARFGAQPNTSSADTSPPGDPDRPSIPAWNVPAAGSRHPTADRAFLGCRPTAAVQTDCGGVFFLLNLGIRLGLYGDFTMPAAPGIPLPIWDFVTLLGLRLAGPRASGDAVWPLLAELSNRSPDDTPGAHFDPPRSWRVPAEWLQPFSPRGTWHWHVAAGRLRVRHPFGFLVLDVARSFEEDDERQTTRELAEYGDAARIRLRPLRRGRSGRRSCSPLERWMAWLLTYVRRRLAVALPGLTARTAGPLLCRQPGAVLVTPAHVHVALSLESLPIEVRLSGLDRDPGWIPAAGRHVTFAFE